MSAALDAFRSEVSAKIGGLSSKQWIDAHPGAHLWASYDGLQHCAFCGVLRSRSGETKKPCRGMARIALRASKGGEP